jgi:cytochrome c553
VRWAWASALESPTSPSLSAPRGGEETLGRAHCKICEYRSPAAERVIDGAINAVKPSHGGRVLGLAIFLRQSSSLAASMDAAKLLPTVLATMSLAFTAAAADTIAAKEQLCASCHGKNGLPSDHTVPIIRGQRAAYLKKQLDDYRDGDRESQIMSSIAESLREDEIRELAADFGGAKWPEQPKAPLPAAPVAIAACQACHNADFTGAITPSGVAPRLAGQYSAYLVATMTAYADGERANSPVMAPLMQSLSPTDRTTIAEYLAALR